MHVCVCMSVHASFQLVLSKLGSITINAAYKVAGEWNRNENDMAG